MNFKKQSIKGFNFFLAFLVFTYFVYFIIKRIPSSNFSFSFLAPYKNLIIQGWLNSILISIIALFCSLIIGFVIYIMTINNIPFLRYFIKYLAIIFNEIIFGSPLLVFVLIIYYFIGTAFNYSNRMVLGTAALSLYMAPYMTNLFKGAIESIDENQHMAAKLFGFTTIQKYQYIILPQIIKIIMPPLSGNLTFIIKGSSILYVIGYKELFYSISTAQSRTYAFTEGYILMLVSYLLITIPLIRITNYLERRYA
ncbi:amino acid ABC transporter membrane protein (PAAT family) [Hypnocyclicus thermotrophus]|uniref:Amino acid ABC transporter membrane protein (PAAT family) n=1 Tax=Hypnocyclicus thermotrophus TaxID=1627895 RepID=A0AA46DY16_9FUSO|nr:ABC transporter permease subunit [Hypnocyclicus thermotrophus]TDT69233.1 amino acid ABC transporter membrane protein (PAAT family) [Hypnocyclicus thermotrophus]